VVTISADLLTRAGIGLSPAAFEALVEALLEQLGEERAASLPTDRLPAAEAAALHRAGLVEGPRPTELPDPVAELAVAHAALVGSSLTVNQAAQQLGVDPSRVRQRLQDRTLYGFKQRGEWRLPAFQFEAQGLLPGLDLVLPRLDPNLHPVVVLRWLTLPCPDLEIGEQPVSPRDWLRTGGSPSLVAALAAELL
jgi:hypothetical protein